MDRQTEQKEIALQHHCHVIYYKYSLGNDVGRAIGAREAKGDIVLFLDGDIVIDNKELQRFIKRHSARSPNCCE